MVVNMCSQGLVIVDFTNSNYPPLEIIGLVVSRSQVKTVEFPEKRDSRDGDMTEFPENRDSVVKGLNINFVIICVIVLFHNFFVDRNQTWKLRRIPGIEM